MNKFENHHGKFHILSLVAQVKKYLHEVKRIHSNVFQSPVETTHMKGNASKLNNRLCFCHLYEQSIPGWKFDDGQQWFMFMIMCIAIHNTICFSCFILCVVLYWFLSGSNSHQLYQTIYMYLLYRAKQKPVQTKFKTCLQLQLFFPFTIVV